MDIGRGSAHLDDEKAADAGFTRHSVGQQSRGLERGLRRGDDGAADEIRRLVQSFGLGDMGDEDLPDELLGRSHVNGVKTGEDIARTVDLLAVPLERLSRGIRRRAVASHQDGALDSRPGQHLGIVGDGLLVAAVRSPTEEHDVAPGRLDRLDDLLVDLEAVAGHQFGPGSQTGPARRLQGELRHQPEGRHLEAAGGAAARVLARRLRGVDAVGAGQLGQRDGDVGLDGRGRLGPAEDDFFGQIDGRDLGIGGTEVHQQVDAARNAHDRRLSRYRGRP